VIFTDDLHKAFNEKATPTVTVSQPMISDDEYLRARAMMSGYLERHRDDGEQYETILTEYEFNLPIHNPEGGGRSRTFEFAGKIDALLKDKKTGRLYLMEHKTASALSADYLSRLWCDTQIALYARAMQQLGHDVSTVIYDVLLKTRIKLNEGESEEEFELRRSELAAKNKSGKSTAKRHVPETQDQYVARLTEHHLKPESYHRELILLSDQRLKMVDYELWDAAQRFLEARRRGHWGMNTASCFSYGRPCEYFEYCRSGHNELILNNEFQVTERPHPEFTLNNWNDGILTNSSINTMRACMLKYNLKYTQKLRPVAWTESPALTFGTIIHEALDLNFNLLHKPFEERRERVLRFIDSSTHRTPAVKMSEVDSPF